MEIRKFCKTLDQAERYQDKLYDQYPVVQLISSPLFEESGYYIWKVSKE